MPEVDPRFQEHLHRYGCYQLCSLRLSAEREPREGPVLIPRGDRRRSGLAPEVVPLARSQYSTGPWGGQSGLPRVLNRSAGGAFEPRRSSQPWLGSPAYLAYSALSLTVQRLRRHKRALLRWWAHDGQGGVPGSRRHTGARRPLASRWHRPMGRFSFILLVNVRSSERCRGRLWEGGPALAKPSARRGGRAWGLSLHRDNKCVSISRGAPTDAQVSAGAASAQVTFRNPSLP